MTFIGYSRSSINSFSALTVVWVTGKAFGLQKNLASAIEKSSVLEAFGVSGE